MLMAKNSFPDYTEMPGTDPPMTPEEAEQFCKRWELLRQYPRRVVDQQENSKFRYLTQEELLREASIDPCPTCICVRFMGEGYCNRPCKRKRLHEAFHIQQNN